MYDFPIRAGAQDCAFEDGDGARSKRAPLATFAVRRGLRIPCLSLDRIKREKGVWWMPWQQEAMKDVIPCDKQRGAGNGL